MLTAEWTACRSGRGVTLTRPAERSACCRAADFRDAVFPRGTQTPARHTPAAATASTLALGTEPTAQSPHHLGTDLGGSLAKVTGEFWGTDPLGGSGQRASGSRHRSSLRGAVLSAPTHPLSWALPTLL